jgi:hypothetical protein
MQTIDTHESPEQLVASLQRQRTLKLVGVVIGLIATLAVGCLTVVLMFNS